MPEESNKYRAINQMRSRALRMYIDNLALQSYSRRTRILPTFDLFSLAPYYHWEVDTLSYGETDAQVGTAIEPLKRASLTDRLRMEKARLEERLEEVNTILQDLDDNPDTARILDKMASLGHIPY